jgi:transcriptional regulator with XRE-family HTH domain
MPYSLDYIADALKAARARRGLSQRALSEIVGIPQSHISKIENGAVDLQTSNLIELARALDLELVLVPKSILPALEGIERSSKEDGVADELVRRKLEHIYDRADRLRLANPTAKTFESLVHTIEATRPLRLDATAANRVADLTAKLGQELDKFERKNTSMNWQRRKREALYAIKNSTDQLRILRNALAHGMVDAPSERRPAYSLDETDG